MPLSRHEASAAAEAKRATMLADQFGSSSKSMRSSKLFVISLTTFVVVLLCYGLKRFTLGIDFTDEGAHIAWPMRILFGEKLFASEPALLLRPLIAYVSVLFKIHPAITLYEFRMVG